MKLLDCMKAVVGLLPVKDCKVPQSVSSGLLQRMAGSLRPAIDAERSERGEREPKAEVRTLPHVRK